MDERIVAADASPLITLAPIGAFDLLRELFGGFVVTTAVRDEVMAGGTRPGVRELSTAIEEGWAVVQGTPRPLRSFGAEAPERPVSSRSRRPSAGRHCS